MKRWRITPVAAILAALLLGTCLYAPPAANASMTYVMVPGDRGADVRGLQHRLFQRDLFGARTTGAYDTATQRAVSRFQQNSGLRVTGKVNESTWRKLTSLTWSPSDQERFNRFPAVSALDGRCATGHVLCVDKGDRKLRWVVDGQVRMVLDARFGASSTPTREGRFEVYYKDRDHVSDLFGSAMPYSMFFSGGQAVHYSSDFAANGYSGASHGCVNIRDKRRLGWLFDRVRIGDKVIVSWG